ncbi:MAG: glycosyltransferase, partial [Methanobacteriaceae archaeon]
FPSGLVAVLAGKITKTPVFVTAHGSDMFCLYKQHSFMRPVVKYVLKNADEVLVVSEALKKEVLATNITNIDKKVKINWNVVDIEKFKPLNNIWDTKSNQIQRPNLRKEFGINENKSIVMFVGNLIARKKVQYLIKAKKLLKEDCAIVIIGDGPKSEELKELVKSENIDDVIFTGPRGDVENLIPQSTILVLPSVSESFGLVLIEALACGKPVIGSNVEGIIEIITKDVGILVEPRNEKALATAIDKILEDNELRHHMEENARTRAIEFSEVEIPY